MWRTQLKLPFSLAMGSVVTLGLFVVMQQLISGGPGATGSSASQSAIYFGPVKIEPPPAPKDRPMPIKPKPPEAPPRPANPLPVEIDWTPADLAPQMPGLTLVPGRGGSSSPSLCGSYTGECYALAEDAEVVALARLQPLYPSRQALLGVEGYVTVEFTITAAGTVIDAKVIDAKPRRVFDRAALSAIAKWKFRPRIVRGQAVARRATQTLDFRLDS